MLGTEVWERKSKGGFPKPKHLELCLSLIRIAGSQGDGQRYHGPARGALLRARGVGWDYSVQLTQLFMGRT